MDGIGIKPWYGWNREKTVTQHDMDGLGIKP